MWPQVPRGVQGRPIRRKECEQILGYGKAGVCCRDSSTNPARLNFGDCLTYATARLAGQPLLCLGGDFAKTDLPIA